MGNTKIGSTLKGIGPTYTDKIAHKTRAGEILRSDFHELYKCRLKEHLMILKNYGFQYDLNEYETGWFEGIEILKKFRIVNTEYLINDLLASGKECLLKEHGDNA